MCQDQEINLTFVYFDVGVSLDRFIKAFFCFKTAKIPSETSVRKFNKEEFKKFPRPRSGLFALPLVEGTNPKFSLLDPNLAKFVNFCRYSSWCRL